MSGKILTIKSIKNCNGKRKTWIHRIRQYQGVYKTYRKRRNLQETIKNKTFEDKETLTSTRDSLKNKEIQTEIIIKPPVPTKSIGLQSELVNLSSASQQTLHSTSRFLVRKGNKSQIPTLKSLSRFCQTFLITQASIGIQCKVATQERAINTEDFLKNSYAQVESDLFLTTGGVASSNTGKDFEVLIYMLNEIGDIVINQNQLLNNNREMLNHILQLNLLRRVKSTESATR